MTIEQRVAACIAQIDSKGFYIIDEEPNESTFEFIYKVQKSGEYFLDLTPAKTDDKKKWVLRDDPKNRVSESVIKTNKLQRVILLVTCGLSLATLIVAYLDYKKETPSSVYLLPQTNQKGTQQLQTIQQPVRQIQETPKIDKISSDKSKPSVLPTTNKTKTDTTKKL
jgi:hypothetical protein